MQVSIDESLSRNTPPSMRQLKQLRTWQQVSHEMAYSMVCCTTLVRSRVSLESALLRAMVQILAALIAVVY